MKANSYLLLLLLFISHTVLGGRTLALQRVFNEVTGSDYTQLFFRYLDGIHVSGYDRTAIVSHYAANKSGTTLSIIIGKKGTITKVYDNGKLVKTDTVSNRYGRLYSAIKSHNSNADPDKLFWQMFIKANVEVPKKEKIAYYEEWKDQLKNVHLTDQYEIGLPEIQELGEHLLGLLGQSVKLHGQASSIDWVFDKVNKDAELYLYPRFAEGNYIAKYDNVEPQKPEYYYSERHIVNGIDVIPGFLQVRYTHANSNTVLPVRKLLKDFYFNRLFSSESIKPELLTTYHVIPLIPDSRIPQYAMFNKDGYEGPYHKGKIYKLYIYKRSGMDLLYTAERDDKGNSKSYELNWYFTPTSREDYEIQQGTIPDNTVNAKINNIYDCLARMDSDIISAIPVDDVSDRKNLTFAGSKKSIERKTGDAALVNMYLYSHRIVPVKTANIYFPSQTDKYRDYNHWNPYPNLITDSQIPLEFQDYILYTAFGVPFRREGTIFNYLVAAHEYADSGDQEASLQQYMAAYMRMKDSYASSLHQLLIEHDITEGMSRLYDKRGMAEYNRLLKLNDQLLMIQALHPSYVMHDRDDFDREYTIAEKQSTVCRELHDQKVSSALAIAGAVASGLSAGASVATSYLAGNGANSFANSDAQMYMNRTVSFANQASDYSAAFHEGMEKLSKVAKVDDQVDVNDFDVVWRNVSQMTTSNLLNTYYLVQGDKENDSELALKLKQKFIDAVSTYVQANAPYLKDKLVFDNRKAFEDFAKAFGSNEILQFNLALRGIKQ